MRLKTYYEWCAETVDCNDDIVDADHAELGELASLLPLHADQRLCVVKNVGNDEEGLQDRQWAYVNDDGFICDEFTPPKKIRAELFKQRAISNAL